MRFFKFFYFLFFLLFVWQNRKHYLTSGHGTHVEERVQLMLSSAYFDIGCWRHFGVVEFYHLDVEKGRTGHSGNETLVAGAFTISHTKSKKRGFLEKFWGPFGFFCRECHRDLLIPVRLWCWDGLFLRCMIGCNLF
jgi:hypothetical protein